jgi:molybdenum cofactor cytidylyltransferase
MICALILAAGESRRMGEPKMLLPWGDTTILEAVVGTALVSPVDKVLVVLGAERKRISGILKSYPVEPVFNPDFQRGMLSSVQAGFAALPEEARAALILLGDQPFVSGTVLGRLCAASVEYPDSIILPVFMGRRGHPLLVPAVFREEIPRLSDSQGLRELIHRHADRILEIEVEQENILLDIDDPDSYRAALRKET